MTLDELPQQYRVVHCDIWGCIHDGVHLYPGAAERLRRWKGEGRTVILITNAPRTAEAVAGQLDRLGLQRELWDGVATSGDAGIAALKTCPAPVGFLGWASDRVILEAKGVRIADTEDFSDLAAVGLEEERPTVPEYREQFIELVGRDVLMHCLNPDRVVIRGGRPEPCAGALADLYIELGGRVEWYGKPHRGIYDHAFQLADDPDRNEVVAIGDGLYTDALGAARLGLACVFVTGGVHHGQPFPETFASDEGLGDWHPLAVVPSLH
jgi:HAD superfamily hydrolase (TIGR01459 family)